MSETRTLVKASPCERQMRVKAYAERWGLTTLLERVSSGIDYLEFYALTVTPAVETARHEAITVFATRSTYGTKGPFRVRSYQYTGSTETRFGADMFRPMVAVRAMGKPGDPSARVSGTTHNGEVTPS
jgi:hypothetical protein